MPKLWETILNIFNFIGDNSGCHQMSNRSFTIKGYTFPICARCTGVFVGQFLSILLLLFGTISNVWLSIMFAGIMLLDWSMQSLGILQSTNLRRLITGVLGGLGFWSLFIIIFKYIASIVGSYVLLN